MARYKVVKPKDKKYELLKKRQRIRITVDIIYFILLITGVVICGINQSDSTFIGWAFIAMGILSIPLTVFHIYIEIKGWRPLRWYNDPEYRQYAVKEITDNDACEDRFLGVFEIILLILFTIGITVGGIIKLLNVPY
ncbi:MAG: hypothetical protein IJX51_07370 [Clostridia bacterium]|nr:hypothetical protein [Clostridia bacterium]